MKLLLILLIILAVAGAVWLFMIAPRLNSPALLQQLKKYRYAHRGLHNIKAGVPENSLLAFRLAMEQGYGMELDVHLSQDGKLVVEHDDSLRRTCGVEGTIEQSTWDTLKTLRLEGTQEHLPLLEEVFDLVQGKVPLLIELKVVGGNYNALSKAVYEALTHYSGAYCVESFDPRAIQWFCKNAPRVVRGQLAGYLRKSGTKISPVLDFAIRNLLIHLLSRPDFVAYHYKDHKNISLRICRSLFGTPVFFWTVKSVEGENLTANYKASAIFETFE